MNEKYENHAKVQVLILKGTLQDQRTPLLLNHAVTQISLESLEVCEKDQEQG